MTIAGKKITTKTIVKWLILIAILNILYKTPRTDWDNDVKVFIKNGDREERYAPKQSSYLKYAIAWWKNEMANKGIGQILDEHVLAPIGITFQE